jgi:hypothetical protein
MSIAELRRMFKAKESQIDALRARRRKLLSELAVVESRLSSVANGVVRGARRALAVRGGGRRRRKAAASSGRRRVMSSRSRSAAGRRGPRGDEGVHNFIRKVLVAARAPMKLAEIAKRVLASGYRTTSSRFAVIVGQRLSEMKGVRKAGRGMYALRG